MLGVLHTKKENFPAGKKKKNWKVLNTKKKKGGGGGVFIKCVPASLIGYGTGKIGAKIAHRVAVEIFGKQCLPLHRSKTNTHYETCKILFHHLCFFVNKNGCGCFYQEALFYFLTSFLTATPSVVRK